MGFYRGPKIVTDGLVLALDAANPKSYPGSGTTWYDLSGNGNHATLYNSPVWNGTYFSFDGTNSYASFTVPTSSVYFPSASLTYEITFQEQNNGIEINRQRIVFGNKGYSTNKDGFALTHGSNPNDVYSQINDFGTNSLRIVDCGVNLDDDGTTDDTLNFTWVMHFTQIDNTNLSTVIHNTYNFSNSNLIVQNTQDIVSNVVYNDLVNDGAVYNIGAGYTGGASSLSICDVASIKIYNRILIVEEITQNYNATKSRFKL